MLIFDAHLDMAWNALEWNRDLELPVSEIRKFERQFPGMVDGDGTVSWHDLRKGGVGITISTLLPRLNRKQGPMTHYQSREAAYASAMGQLTYYRALVEKGLLFEIHNAATLDLHIEVWTGDETAARAEGSSTPIGFILSMEGAPSILNPSQIEEWYNNGLRILGPAHYGPNEYCHGTGSEGGLSERGRELIREMDRVGMLLDVTHLADISFWQALEIYTGPVLASHHNCRALVDGDRQLADTQIKALVERGAVIGAAFDNWMIKPGWKRGVSDPSTVKVADIADHTDHICQLAGSARHCGIGTDLDGGFGKEQSPSDLETIANLEIFADILEKRGYSADDIALIMSGNFIRFFREAWA